MIRKESIAVLPGGWKPIRILQIGDIHLAPWQKRKIRFLKSLANLETDLVVNTGDNLGHKDSIEPLLEALGPLLKKPGVFVNGSNDYYAPTPKNPVNYIFRVSAPPKSEALDTQKMVEAFESAGWTNLNNAQSELTVSGEPIWFIGTDDWHIGKADLAKLLPSNKFTIGVTHAPYLRVLEGLALLGASMVFSGHTHGGQVRLPLVGALTTNSDLPNRYARGKSDWEFSGKKMILSVVAGLGNSIYAPIRFFCRPEVRFITLLPK